MLLEVKHLKTWFPEVRAVDDVSLSLKPGETLGVVGESGSGKTVTAYSVLRLLPESQIALREGQVLWEGSDLLTLPITEMPRYRGGQIAMVFQEPQSSLNPVLKVGYQVAEAYRQHHPVGWPTAWSEAERLLAEVGVTRPGAYPHELSGGMKQRVVIAMALACEPKLLICDEPTTALDVTTQKEILELIQRIQKDRGMAILYITHDLGVVAAVADRVAVMCPGETLRKLGVPADRGGHVVEYGTVEQILTNPQHPYTKALVACRPTLQTNTRRLPTIEQPSVEAPRERPLQSRSPGASSAPPFRPPEGGDAGAPHVVVEGLKVWFPVKVGLLGRTVDYVKAVDGVDLVIPRGGTLGLVGESGCGKTTLGRAILDLVPRREGKVTPTVDRRKMQIVFQDPYSSLNPRLTIEEALTEPMRVHGLEGNHRDRAAALLEKVGLQSQHLKRYPHEFSGGQRQRIGIARTLSVEPEFIVCDESVSALDVSVQAGVLNLLLDLQEELGLTYLFISHDLAVVKFMSDRVAVMASDFILENGGDRGGHIVEELEDLAQARHPYTLKLLKAVPQGLLRCLGR